MKAVGMRAADMLAMDLREGAAILGAAPPEATTVDAKQLV
jgi:hypothetical protein